MDQGTVLQVGRQRGGGSGVVVGEAGGTVLPHSLAGARWFSLAGQHPPRLTVGRGQRGKPRNAHGLGASLEGEGEAHCISPGFSAQARPRAAPAGAD